jgi:hypothetical protein
MIIIDHDGMIVKMSVYGNRCEKLLAITRIFFNSKLYDCWRGYKNIICVPYCFKEYIVDFLSAGCLLPGAIKSNGLVCAY